ncbi:helix-turn-helix transcriptional regulator [Kribbella sp. VKM Ac-2566]|uniref:helix-turn-helix transcriptional regulator n=1 Tax=Kribbella sp. VKM Ac-2566 TaxID=2512218 RepID=UPI0010E836DE|nr:helix-turn-helix transcriptional regulator [Kribbella sp. VKM Ac-2566]TDW98239.1 helix-turn-helix protein [Kribbella sp. VKM Ac-2566]
MQRGLREGSPVRGPETPTDMPGFSMPGDHHGVISGYVLKMLRGSIGKTQTSLAERLGVDVSTVQGWETGRRSLTSLRVSDFRRLQTRLAAFGAPATGVASLHDAVEADELLGQITSGELGNADVQHHPLASTVHRRRLVNLVTWPFTGITPPQLRGLPAKPGRGPVASHPVLTIAAQHEFFDQLLSVAERASPEDMPVLRRQATYLLGFDKRQESADWLAVQHKHAFNGSMTANLTSGIAARSAAVALARHGDADPLRYFIDNTLSDERHAAANLTYWAYWLGEINEPHTDDAYLITATSTRSWSGVRLANHLLEHLTDQVNAPLNIHSLWQLVLARPELLEYDRELRQRTGERVETALDDNPADSSTVELNNLRCAVQLANR